MSPSHRSLPNLSTVTQRNPMTSWLNPAAHEILVFLTAFKYTQNKTKLKTWKLVGFGVDELLPRLEAFTLSSLFWSPEVTLWWVPRTDPCPTYRPLHSETLLNPAAHKIRSVLRLHQRDPHWSPLYTFGVYVHSTRYAFVCMYFQCDLKTNNRWRRRCFMASKYIQYKRNLLPCYLILWSQCAFCA